MRSGVFNGDSELPSNLYKVSVPTIATYSEYEMDNFGIPVSVFNGEPKDSMEDMATVMLPLNKIIDIFIDGNPIVLLERNKLDEIYQLLEDYVNGINYSQDHSINRVAVKDERVTEIDKFLSEIFGYNKSTIVKGQLHGGSGFDIGIASMGIGSTRVGTGSPVIVDSEVDLGVADGYDIEYVGNEHTKQGVTYISETTPVIDMSKIKRTPLTKHRRGVEYNKD